MRVIAGKRGGESLYTPDTKEIRPIQDKVKASLFNIWQNLVEERRFLDLFAGTGSVGIEALSQGAREVTFVDNSPRAVRLIRKNLDKLNLTAGFHLYQKDVAEAISMFARRGQVFDLIFMGPPYGKELADETLSQLAETQILQKWGVAAAEISKKDHLKTKYGEVKLIDEREYGGTLLKFYSYKIG